MGDIRTPNPNPKRNFQPVVDELKQKLAGQNQPTGRLNGANNANANFTPIDKNSPAKGRGGRFKFANLVPKALNFKATKDGSRPPSPEGKLSGAKHTDNKDTKRLIERPDLEVSTVGQKNDAIVKGFKGHIRKKRIEITPLNKNLITLKSNRSEIKVEVQFKTGKLEDQKKPDILAGNVVQPGEEKQSTSKIGINNMAVNAPIIMLLKDKDNNLSVSLENVDKVKPQDWRDRINHYQDNGYTVERIITGRHETPYPTQDDTISKCATNAEDLGIAFRFINFKDKSLAHWWISAEIGTEKNGDKQKLTINVGSADRYDGSDKT